MRQIILDTETTGLEFHLGHRIIEIACVEMINRKLSGKHFHYYLNPEREIDEGAQAVHGLTKDFLADKLKFAEIAEAFLDFVKDSELIIHNAPFDLGFINGELQLWQSGRAPIETQCPVLDTLIMARQLHVGQRNSLDALCKRYAIDNSHRELHGALLDSHLLARVYLAMTGGQATLFGSDMEGDSNRQHLKTVTVKDSKKRQLLVLKADEAELKEHQNITDKMREKGICLWDEYAKI